MNHWLDGWATLNTVVIMFALGLSDEDGARHTWVSWPVWRAVLGYNLIIPALLLWAVIGFEGFSPAVTIGMALCIAAGGGTSGGAFVLGVRGATHAAAKLITLLALVSLAAVILFTGLQILAFGALSFAGLATYLLGVTLMPLGVAIIVKRYFPAGAARIKVPLEKLGSVLVILLVMGLALRYGAEILQGPEEPLWASLLLVAVFVVPALFERQAVWRRTVVMVTLIRNLSLVLSLLAVLPQAADVMPTVLSFGLFMYVTAGGLLWFWRSKDG